MKQAAGRANRNTVPATDAQFFRLGNRGGICARGEVDQFGRADSTAEAILAAGLLVRFDESHSFLLEISIGIDNRQRGHRIKVSPI
ncbi:hypothetical protein P9J64_03070 [Deltaproteobacteria bacterium IMCC39524]|nr:hypothetical protein [Deltaproteobacteria bacterium IMCC39524]